MSTPKKLRITRTVEVTYEALLEWYPDDTPKSAAEYERSFEGEEAWMALKEAVEDGSEDKVRMTCLVVILDENDKPIGVVQ